ncbi:mechanosensitive ion channel family protein [Kordiimonas pumila]|uniref:Small-conductance mechanosensitive channel n=1 Tax=Kordiimonas pumila TaxID=2161677 RepID=A0ABV7D6Q5_9PROT|nr:mechanosensitive ion channel domain-containing protein [Kordiimonas pumila]
MDLLNDNEQMDVMLAQAIDMGLSVIGAILILIIGLWLAGAVKVRLGKILGRSEKMDETVSHFLASLAKYAVIIFTVIAILGQFGVETTSLVAVIGAAGLAIGLALQGTLSNVAAGVMLLIFRPFRVGQFVDVGGTAGVVKAITLFVTEMDTPDNVRITVPNSSVWGSSIKNFNHHDTRRLDMVFGIGYGADINKAMDIIRKALAADERCMKEPEAVVAVSNLGESSVDIMVRVWCLGSDYWPLKWALLKTVKENFNASDVDIPFPSRTLYIEKED